MHYQWLFRLFQLFVALSLAYAAALPASNSPGRRPRTGPVRLRPKPALAGSNASHNEFSTNWAGAAYHDFPPGTFTQASTTITVPSISRPSGGQTTVDYWGSAWVGIDGYGACSDAILQTGIDWLVPADGGQVDYYAWYEWYPDPSFDFDEDLVMDVGDKLKFTVQASSPTAGLAIVENLSTGARVSQQLTSDVPLCRTDAEWIVEDFDIDDGAAPFANFGSVTFTNAVATFSGGGVVGPGGNASLIDLEQDDAGVLAHTVLSGGSVVVQYV